MGKKKGGQLSNVAEDTEEPITRGTMSKGTVIDYEKEADFGLVEKH